MTLDEIKKFIHVDFTDDDDYISLLIEVAKEEIVDCIGNFNPIIARHKLLLVTIINTLYENRLYTVKENEKVSYAIRSMILKLQLDEVL